MEVYARVRRAVQVDGRSIRQAAEFRNTFKRRVFRTIRDIRSIAPSFRAKTATISSMRVFLSSTFEDLREERRAAADAIARSGFQKLLMEDEPLGQQLDEAFRRLIDEADIFLLILGERYGTRAPGQVNSWIHREYEIAKASGKPILVFAKNVRSPFGDMVRAMERSQFLAQVERERLVVPFNSPGELAPNHGGAHLGSG